MRRNTAATALVADYRDHVYPRHPDSLRARHDLDVLREHARENPA